MVRGARSPVGGVLDAAKGAGYDAAGKGETRRLRGLGPAQEIHMMRNLFGGAVLILAGAAFGLGCTAPNGAHGDEAEPARGAADAIIYVRGMT